MDQKVLKCQNDWKKSHLCLFLPLKKQLTWLIRACSTSWGDSCNNALIWKSQDYRWSGSQEEIMTFLQRFAMVRQLNTDSTRWEPIILTESHVTQTYPAHYMTSSPLISEMFHSCLFCSTKSPRCWEDLNGQYRAKVDTPSKLPRHWRHNWPRRRFLPLPICCFSCRSVEVFSLAMYLQTQVVSQRYWEWIETATATAMETATIWL